MISMISMISDELPWSDKEETEAVRVQIEEKWRSKAAERDEEIEDLQGHLWKAERSREAAEDRLKNVRVKPVQ